MSTEVPTIPPARMGSAAQRGRIEIKRDGKTSVVLFQFNPSSLRRKLSPKMVGGNSESKATPLYFTGPPVETIDVRFELAADEAGTEIPWKDVKEHGVRPMLAALETAMYPQSDQIESAEKKLRSGKMEIGVFGVPLITFIWGECKAPVKFTSMSVTEQQFNKKLVPTLATVDLSMQVLTVEDVRNTDDAHGIYLAYQKNKEKLAKKCFSKNSAAKDGASKA